MNQPVTPVKWGILGTAKIATKVSKAIHAAEGAELVAVASRSLDRAREWGTAHGVPRAYGSYEELLSDPELDAIYIPLPPSLHAEWTIKAAEAGKHVLCEKPLAVTAAEAREMIAACRAHGVQLMDGVMWSHHPRTEAMRSAIDAGKLGRLRTVTSAFSFDWGASPPENIRFHRELGGGALGDVGWYCVRAILWAFGDLPERVFATARYYRDVDVHLTAILWFSDERIGTLDCGFDTVWRKWFEVAGTGGSLVCDDFVVPWNVEKARFWLHDSQGKGSEEIARSIVQEVKMIEHFGSIVRSGALDDYWPQIALATQQVCDALEASARRKAIAEVADGSFR